MQARRVCALGAVVISVFMVCRAPQASAFRRRGACKPGAVVVAMFMVCWAPQAYACCRRGACKLGRGGGSHVYGLLGTSGERLLQARRVCELGAVMVAVYRSAGRLRRAPAAGAAHVRAGRGGGSHVYGLQSIKESAWGRRGACASWVRWW